MPNSESCVAKTTENRLPFGVERTGFSGKEGRQQKSVISSKIYIISSWLQADASVIGLCQAQWTYTVYSVETLQHISVLPGVHLCHFAH